MAAHTQFKQYAYVWKPAFGQRQTLAYSKGNMSFVESIHRPQVSGITTGQVLNTLTTEQIIDTFVSNQFHQDVARYSYVEHLYEEFLRGVDFEVLKGKVPSTALGEAALLDDRNDAKGTRDIVSGYRRQSRGAMNAAQLYTTLLEPRVNTGTITSTIPDAERRTLYINDLDPLCVLAMAVTVPYLQANFLRDFIHRHLSWRSLIGGNIPTVGSSRFSLEFHLPYYVWRSLDLDVADMNKSRQAYGKPLRKSEEVIYLKFKDKDDISDGDGAKEEEKAYIHEAQISIMVTGLDDWYWTAYCFIDVYFKSPGHHESVEYYSNTNRDPLSGGKTSTILDKPAWLPREYFLQLLMYRIEQVQQEWSNAVYQLLRHIQPCIHSFTRGETGLGEIEELDITQQKGFKWTIRVLRQFTHLLSKTIDSWESFKDGELRYFCAPDTQALAQPSWGRYLAAIDKDVIELRDLRSSLLHQTELFENMTNSIVTHAAHAETVVTRLQTQFIQALTVITILYLPPTLASTIFSMQSILPKDASIKHWIYTLIGLFFGTLILILNLPVLKTAVRRSSGFLDKIHMLVIDRWNNGFEKRPGVVDADEDEDDDDDGIELHTVV